MTKATAIFFAPRRFFIQRSAARAAAAWPAIAFGYCVAILAWSSSAGPDSAPAAAAQPPVVQAPVGPSVQPAGEAWIGKRIIPAHRDVQLHSGTAVVGPIAEVVVRVEDARDNQLLVRSLGRAGWIAVAEAVPLEEAVAYFTAKIKQNPGALQRASHRLVPQTRVREGARRLRHRRQAGAGQRAGALQ